MIVLLLLLALAVSFLFSGMEAGLLSVNPVRVRHQAERGDKSAIVLQRMLVRGQRMFMTVLVVTNFMNICALVLGARILTERLGNWGYPVLLAIAIPVYVVLVEALAKSIFRRFPHRLLAVVLPLLRVASWLFAPLMALGGLIAKFFPGLRLKRRSSLFVAREHFKNLTSLSERHGGLAPIERRMIHGVVDFRGVTVSEVMLPMDQVALVEPSAPVKAVLEIGRSRGLDRVPVVGPDGKLVGLVNLFEILVDRAEYRGVGPYVRRLISVSPGERAYSVIRKLRAARLRMAAVVDRSGMPLGVVTEEALVGRLVSAATSDSAPAENLGRQPV